MYKARCMSRTHTHSWVGHVVQQQNIHITLRVPCLIFRAMHKEENQKTVTTKDNEPETDIMEQQEPNTTATTLTTIERVGSEIIETKKILWFFKIHVCVWCMCICACSCTYTCVPVWRPEVNIGVFIDHSLPYFLRQGLSLTAH